MSDTAEPATAAQKDPLRIVLVDDHDLFRTGLRNLLEEQGVIVAGEAGTGGEALRMVEELAPDVVVMDLNMPGMGGVDATRHISSIAPLTRVLARRDARLRTLAASARATEASLASARAARVAYLAQLAAQQRLNRSEISSLESQAQTIESQAQAAAVRQAATPAVTAIGVPPEPVVTTGGHTMTVVATGYSLRGRTATGAPVGWGVVAVDPSVIPLGTSMTVPGYGAGVAADTGGGIRGAMIDLWFPSTAQASAWGRRTVTITLH